MILRRAERQREEGGRGAACLRSVLGFFARVWVLSCSEAERGERREKREKARFGVGSQLVRRTLSVDAAHERRTRERVGGVAFGF